MRDACSARSRCGGGAISGPGKGTQFTCSTSTKVQILTLEELRAREAA